MTDPAASTAPTTPALRPLTFEIPTAVALKLAEWHEGTLEHAALTALKLYHGVGPAAYSTLTELAKQLDRTPAHILRESITAFAAASAKARKATNAPGVLGRPVVNEARDTAIFTRLSDGRTQAEVAAEFGISIVRVGQIAAQQRILRGMPTRVGPTARNAEIVRRVLAGDSRADIARHFNVSRSTVDTVMALSGETAPRRRAQPQTQPVANQAETFKIKTPEPTPPAPRVLAVIPPSMKNPELLAGSKPVKIPDPATVDVSMFDPNNPDFAL